MLPNFLICGTQKSGTTSLYNLLVQHPEIGMSDIKEIHFFDVDSKFHKGISWYEQFFENCKGKKAIGEATPHYYRLKYVPERVKAALGEIKLIFLLRNPIDRAWSNYHFNIGRGAELRSFTEAIETDDGWHRYIEKGFYFKFIKKWLQHFSRDSLKIVIFEEMISESLRVLNQIASFLDVNEEFSEYTSVRSNPTSIPRNKAIQFAMYCYASLRLYKLLPEAGKVLMRNSLKGKLMRFGYPEMEPKVREHLHALFGSENSQLESFIGRNIYYWHNNRGS
jgi:hypothetical protein